jgi:hypothetical protein
MPSNEDIEDRRSFVVFRTIVIKDGYQEEELGKPLCLEEKEFKAIYKQVSWDSGANIYGILHEVMGRDTAAKYAEKIEARLALIAEGKNLNQ